MTGYSGTPLAKKLGIKPGHTLALFGAPAGFETALDGLPDDATIVRDPKGPGEFNVAVLFTTKSAELARRFDGIVKRLETAGGFWVAWPKKASKVPTDLTEDVVRMLALERGLVDNKVCAIDEVWSGLRLVRRVKDRRK